MILENIQNFISKIKNEENKLPNPEELKDHFEWELISYNLSLLICYQKSNDRSYLRFLIDKPEKLNLLYQSLKNREIKPILDYMYNNFWSLKKFIVPNSVKVVENLYQLSFTDAAQEILKEMKLEQDYLQKIKTHFNLSEEYRITSSFKNLSEGDFQSYDFKFKDENIQKIFYRYIKDHVSINLDEDTINDILKTELINDEYQMREQITYESVIKIYNSGIELSVVDQLEQNLLIDKGISELERRRDCNKILLEVQSFVADLFFGPYYNVISSIYNILSHWSFHNDFEKDLFEFLMNNKNETMDLREAFEYIMRENKRKEQKEWNLSFKEEYNEFYKKIAKTSKINEDNDNKINDLRKLIKNKLNIESKHNNINIFFNYILDNKSSLDKLLFKFRDSFNSIWKDINRKKEYTLLKIKETQRLEKIKEKNQIIADYKKERTNYILKIKHHLDKIDKKFNPKEYSNEELSRLILLINQAERKSPEDFLSIIDTVLKK